MRKVAGSLLYLLAYLSVLLLSIVVVAWMERHGGLHTWYRQGDIDAALGCLVLGGVLFPSTTLLIGKLERLQRPRLTDHLRHCAAVYALMIATASYLIGAYAEHRDGLGYGVAAAACLLGVFAVALNGLTLWLARSAQAAPQVTGVIR